MKTQYIFILAILVSLIFLSCEKVIELELKNAKQQTVVEAQVNNGVGNNFVILSKSGSFYDSNDFEMVKNAVVKVKDKAGHEFLFTEFKDGYYQNTSLSGNSLEEYSLTIDNSSQVIKSNSIMPNLVLIDSLTAEVQEEGGPMGGGSGNKESSYKIYCHFKDPLNDNNFYKFRARSGSGLQEESSVTSFILNDDMFEGKNARIPIRGIRAISGDTIYVQLFSIDKANYEYFKLLEDTKMSVFSTSIGNPVSNVEGTDVIGIFGANAVDIDTLILK